MTDNGLAALAAALIKGSYLNGSWFDHEDECAAAILGERGVFLPDGAPDGFVWALVKEDNPVRQLVGLYIKDANEDIASLRAALNAAVQGEKAADSEITRLRDLAKAQHQLLIDRRGLHWAEQVDIDGKPYCPSGYAQRYHAIGQCDCATIATLRAALDGLGKPMGEWLVEMMERNMTPPEATLYDALRAALAAAKETP